MIPAVHIFLKVVEVEMQVLYRFTGGEQQPHLLLGLPKPLLLFMQEDGETRFAALRSQGLQAAHCWMTALTTLTACTNSMHTHINDTHSDMGDGHRAV